MKHKVKIKGVIIMAKLSKQEMAETLIHNGWFSQYHGNATKLAKDTSWDSLHDYYTEMRDYETNVKGIA